MKQNRQRNESNRQHHCNGTEAGATAVGGGAAVRRCGNGLPRPRIGSAPNASGWPDRTSTGLPSAPVTAPMSTASTRRYGMPASSSACARGGLWAARRRASGRGVVRDSWALQQNDVKKKTTPHRRDVAHHSQWPRSIYRTVRRRMHRRLNLVSQTLPAHCTSRHCTCGQQAKSDRCVPRACEERRTRYTGATPRPGRDAWRLQDVMQQPLVVAALHRDRMDQYDDDCS